MKPSPQNFDKRAEKFSTGNDYNYDLKLNILL